MLAAAALQAQQSGFFANKDAYYFRLAEDLYNTKVYGAAQKAYASQYFYNATLSASKAEAARFFDNVIGVILQQNHAEDGLQAFMKEYPKSAYFAKANMPLADYYLAKKDFAKALETLSKVNQYQLSREENTQYVLKLGYAKYMQGDTAGAIEALEEAYKTLDAEHRADVAYMLGHLYYTSGDSSKAYSYLDTVKDDPKYAATVRPYYLQLYFNDKNYNRAAQEGESLLAGPIDRQYAAEVHKITGESYFMQGRHQEAYPHLKAYLDSRRDASPSDLYEMGYVAARLQRYDEAVTYYNRLTNSQSAMAQNAYYQLGNAYLQTGRKQEALSAFRSASQMNYDAKVQQLAHAQYAKISYDIGNPFESAPKVIQDFITKYPGAPQVPELKGLLVKSYLYSGDYRETLAAIDRLPSSTPETDKIDQEVSFLLGTQEFNKGDFDAAEKYLSRSLELNENPETTRRAQYWLAQTYYRKGNYASAITRYENLLTENFPEKQQLTYDLGYAYFKSKRFGRAQEYFKQYLQNPSPDFKSDAELRLADTYYAENKLNEAIAIYDKSENADDYTLYQKGLSLGFKGDTAAKISTLKTLLSKYPESEYQDDANYEIGTAYAAQDDFKAARDYFTRVIKNSKDRDLVASASIYNAQLFSDLGQPDVALSELRRLAKEYRNTAYADKTVQAARAIYVQKGDIAGYEAFAREAGISIGQTERDELNLSQARQFYAKKDFSSAIPYYQKYLTQNPSGAQFYQVQYELGESYYQTKDLTKALLLLQEVAAVPNDYREYAQTRAAQIYLSQNKTEEAIRYLEPLSASGDPSVKTFADAELMRAYAAKGEVRKAEQKADEVLKNSKNSAALLESARIVKARSLMQSGRDKDAQSAYAVLEKSSNSEVAAEALYAKAFYQNKAKAFKTSNETVFRLANNYAAEEYWGAKSLLVMARNYIGLKDQYQASYTVDQILANYQEYPDVVNEAREIKKLIK